MDNVIEVEIFKKHKVKLSDEQYLLFEKIRFCDNSYKYDPEDEYTSLNTKKILILSDMVFSGHIDVSDKFWDEYNEWIEASLKVSCDDSVVYRDLKLDYFVTSSNCERHGLYVLYYESEIVYIGKSKNPWKRVQTHKCFDKKFNSHKFIVFADEGLCNIYEPYLIQKYQPKYNKDLLEKTSFNLPEIKL